MNYVLEGFAEQYARATRAGRLFISMSFDPRAKGHTNVDGDYVPARSHAPRRYESHDLEVIVAAGLCRHWATSLLRLKYGLAASEYRNVLPHVLRLAEETGTRLKWNDPELTGFLAVEALHGWLLDRQFHGKEVDWRNRCVTLRKLLSRELHDAAISIQRCL